tara:strand:+ start:432 stop:698 length:267 start_codon:yes stop_codon:yes gene_type:complete
MTILILFKKKFDKGRVFCYIIYMTKIKRLNEIEAETKRIREVLKQNPSSDELDILNAIMDKLVEETLEITQSVQATDLEMLSDMPKKP